MGVVMHENGINYNDKKGLGIAVVLIALCSIPIFLVWARMFFSG